MSEKLFGWMFIILFIILEVIRFPHRKRNKADRRSGKISTSQVAGLETVLMTLSFFGMYVLPFVFALSGWLDFANYPLPDWVGGIGTVLFLFGIWLLNRAHRDLGKSWSPSLEITEGQTLITQGIYSRIRHPIYAAVMLSVIAQLLMLNNWIAGPAGLATYLPIYFLRIPREEKMMLAHFGEEYRGYMKQTGRIFPRF